MPPTAGTPDAPASARAGAARRRFWRAAGETALLELLPWAWDRYVTTEDFSHISIESVRNNLHTGFVFDRDKFSTNQYSHPLHGSLYFNAARTNGFTFWESVPFAFAGSLVWEYAFETEAPSLNDLVNTTLGGVAAGETTYRLSRMIRDNTATGSRRIWLEAGALLVDPMGFLNRLVDGDLGRVTPNPDDRFPASYGFSTDLLFRHAGGSSTVSRQTAATLSFRYGDPLEDDVRRPFDCFDLGVEFATPSTVLIPRAEVRGILASRDVSPSDASRHRLAAALRYLYYNSDGITFGAQGIDLGVLSRWTLARDLDLRTDVSAEGFPLAGFRTDYTRLNELSTGRNYDYGPGGGARVEVRLHTRQVDVVTASFSVGWFHTSNGISRDNRLLSARVEGRWPVVSRLTVGAGWDWEQRFTTYESLRSRTRTYPALKVFASWAFL